MKKKEPKKPETVPEKAFWDQQTGEWVLGKKSKDGRYIGEWKWWLAPKGHLVCHTFFKNDGSIDRYKRFHPNGEVSQWGQMGNDGKFETRVYIRSTEETTELFPYADPSVWRAVDKGTIPVSYDLYDKDGKKLNAYKIPAEMKKGYEDLEPITAFNKVCDLVDHVLKEVGDEFDFFAGFKPVFIENIKEEDLEEAEKRLNLEFPPSYKKFVIDHGLFKIGEEKQSEFRLLPPQEIGRLSDGLEKDWGVDWTKFPARNKEIMDKIIYFSLGDEELQIVWYYCFDYNTLNPETGEVELISFNQHDWHWMMKEDDIEVYKSKISTMQFHMARTCYKVIDNMEYEMDD